MKEASVVKKEADDALVCFIHFFVSTLQTKSKNTRLFKKIWVLLDIL